MNRFAEKTVLVTGASRGLGRAIASAFAREGAHIYVNYRTRAREAGRTLEEVGAGAATALPFDVSQRDAVDEAMARILGERGTLDVLVNNAGVVRDGAFPLLAADDWDDVLGANLGGVFHCTQAAARAMLRRGGGAIVNVGSVAGQRASPGQANYAAAKGGVLAFTRTIAAELAPQGIRVNAVIPGLISAGMAARLDHRIAARHRRRIPVGRFGDADEVARAVTFLASPDASYIVGHALVVDGGISL